MQKHVFYQKLGSVMIDNKYDREITGFRSGKLDTNSLHKVFTGSTRVFKKRQERKNKKYNICIIIDESGSMSGWPIDTSAKLVSILIEGLQKNNIDIAIIGFNRQIWHHKYFSSKKLKKARKVEDIQQRIQTKVYWGGPDTGCSHLYPALQAGHKLLSGQTEGHNILVCFTDGGAGCGDRDCPREAGDSRKCVVEVNKISRIGDVVGVGIGYDIRHVIPDSLTVSDEDEFFNKFLGKLGKIIKRG